MSHPTLAVAGVVQVVTAVVFFAAAVAVHRREVRVEARLARSGFVTWWAGLGAYMALQGVAAVAAALGWAPFQFHLGLRFVTIPLLCAASWGVAAYLGYLYTGRRGLIYGLAVFYAGVATLFYWVVLSHVPLGAPEGPWLAELEYEVPLGGPLYSFVLAAVGLPPILASIGLLGLRRAMRDAVQKRRVTLVATGILAWVGSGLATRLAAVGDLAIFLTLVGGGLLAAVLVFLAYYPPPRVREPEAAEETSKEAPPADGRPRQGAQPAFA